MALIYLNSNSSNNLLGLGEKARFVVSKNVDLSAVDQFIETHQGSYIFACLSYDLKNTTLGIISDKKDPLEFPDALLWVPEVVVSVEENEIVQTLSGDLTDAHEQQIKSFFEAQFRKTDWKMNPKARTSKERYLDTVKQLLHEIQMGSIYEVNYCQEFYDDAFEMDDPEAAYFKLNRITEAPFSAYIALDDFRILSGSPERYLEKKGETLRSQPIKGTSKRGKTASEDTALKNALAVNEKERSENVMIVDLVRNDLSKIAQKSSVNVDELFGIYSFKTVHQMISTVSCKIKPEVKFSEILEATFPMGSMTGAPKLSAVKLIETHEDFKRGLYSGTIGYIAPNGDLDLNVVIRSMIYNQAKKYLSCAVGGAITIQSTPEGEYEECKVKIKTILDQMHE